METQAHLPLNTLIKELILADLRHCQLIFGLEALGLSPLDNHFLGLSNLFAREMGYITDQELDVFYEIYQSFMEKSTSFLVAPNGAELKQLAKECHEALSLASH
jgi:hypothetical protein